MEKVTFDNVVGFILALFFALIIGVSMRAILIGDYMRPDSVLNEHARLTLQIVGFAGGLAALVTWWVQQFASSRGFVIRFLFALAIFVLAFLSFGGLLRVLYMMVTYPNQLDWSPMGLYWSTVNNFYSFVGAIIAPPRPAYAALIVAAAFYLAWFGPRGPRYIRA